MTPTAVQPLRQCCECLMVWLAGEPSAGRLPRTCPHDCNAAVLDVTPCRTDDNQMSLQGLGGT